MAIFGRGYDQDYDAGFRQQNAGYRGNWNRSGGGMRDEGRWNRGENRDFGWGTGPRDFHRYDSGMQSRYDRGFSGGWGGQQQGGYSERFGGYTDRPGGSPFQYGRGNFQEYDRDFGFGSRYDRNFRGNDRQFRESGFPMGYQPYSVREGYDSGYRGRDFPRRDHPWY